MRFLLKVTLPVEAGNAAIVNGSLQKVLESTLSQLKPESAYFVADKGRRTAMIFFDMKDPSQIPAVAEPFFLAFNAGVEFLPAMTLDDLKQAGPGIQDAIKNYARKR